MISIHMYEEYSNTSYHSAPELCEYHSVIYIYIYVNISKLPLLKALARFQMRYKCVVSYSLACGLAAKLTRGTVAQSTPLVRCS